MYRLGRVWLLAADENNVGRFAIRCLGCFPVAATGIRLERSLPVFHDAAVCAYDLDSGIVSEESQGSWRAFDGIQKRVIDRHVGRSKLSFERNLDLGGAA
jgi:hypothetical protein